MALILDSYVVKETIEKTLQPWIFSLSFSDEKIKLNEKTVFTCL